MQLSKMATYAKAFVAAVMPVWTVVQSAVTDDKITTTEWTSIIVSLVVAAGVYFVPNKKAPTGGTMPPSTGSSGPLE